MGLSSYRNHGWDRVMVLYPLEMMLNSRTVGKGLAADCSLCSLSLVTVFVVMTLPAMVKSLELFWCIPILEFINLLDAMHKLSVKLDIHSKKTRAEESKMCQVFCSM